MREAKEVTVGSGFDQGRMKGLWTGLFVASLVVLACVLTYVLLPTDARDKAFGALADGTLMGGVYALLALGVVVVYKATGVFNLTFGGVMMFLAFFAWWLMTKAGVPAWLSFVVVALAGALIGLAINRIFMIHLIGDPGLGPFIVTMVLGFSVVHGMAVILFGGMPTGMPKILPSGGATLGAIYFSYAWLVAFAIALLLFILFSAFFRFTKMGLQMRGVCENPSICQSLGINVKSVFGISWGVLGITAAVCGVLLGSTLQVNTDLSGFALGRAFPVLFLGGMDSLTGALVGGLAIGIVESLSGVYIDPHLTAFRTILPYVIVLIVLIVRPSGLFGSREIRRI